MIIWPSGAFFSRHWSVNKVPINVYLFGQAVTLSTGCVLWLGNDTIYPGKVITCADDLTSKSRCTNSKHKRKVVWLTPHVIASCSNVIDGVYVVQRSRMSWVWKSCPILKCGSEFLFQTVTWLMCVGLWAIHFFSSTELLILCYEIKGLCPSGMINFLLYSINKSNVFGTINSLSYDIFYIENNCFKL